MNKNAHLFGLTGLLILLALWQIGSLILAHSMPLANMLAPAAALGSLKTLLLDGNLWVHIGASLQRVGVGLLAAPQWLELGRSLSATQSEMLFKIMLPAVVGDILNGLRLAIGIVWVVLVPCEMLGVNEGLGYFILDTRDRLAYSELMAAIVLIGVIGWTLDSAARYLAQVWRKA